MVYCQLFIRHFLCYATHAAGKAVTRAGLFSAFLPGTKLAPKLAERSIPEIPMLGWIASVIAFQSVAHFLLGLGRTVLTRPWSPLLNRALLHQALPGACAALGRGGSLDVERSPTIVAHQFSFCRVALPGTKASLTTDALSNRKRFTACPAYLFDLFSLPNIKASAAAISLVWVMWPRNKLFTACRT